MVYLIIVLAVLARFLPHAWNFSPVYGALLFGGARLNKRESIWFPALLLGISDFILTDFVYHLHLGGKVIFQVAAFASISFEDGSCASGSACAVLSLQMCWARRLFI